MKMHIMIASTVFCTLSAQAAKVDYGFLSSSPAEIAKLAGDDIVNSYDMKVAEDWSAEVQKDSRLIEGYKSFETWNPLQATNEVVVYGSEMAVVIPKLVTQADLDRMTDVQFRGQIDSAYQLSVVTSEVANGIYQESQMEGKISASEYVERIFSKGKISDTQKNDLLSQINAQAQVNATVQFCKDPGATCMKAVAIVPSQVKLALKGASTVMADIPEQLELLIEAKPLDRALLGSATAGIVQTGFWANKALVSLKNQILSYDLGNGTSLLTIKTVVAIEKDDLDKFSFIGSYNFIIGESFFNSDEGFMQGLPEAGLDTIRALKEML